MENEQINYGGPAFPCEGGDMSGLHAHPGMSFRDWLAGQALAGLAILHLDQLGHKDIGKMAVALADGTLAALNGKEGV